MSATSAGRALSLPLTTVENDALIHDYESEGLNVYLKDLRFFGCTALEPEVFGNLVKRIENGDIQPLVAAQFPLRDIGQAQAAFAEKAYTGKIVLNVSPQD